MRDIDLRAPDVAKYFRVRTRRPEDFVVGDSVQVFGDVVQQWVEAEVVQVMGLEVTVEYGDKQKVVSLDDEMWPTMLRNGIKSSSAAVIDDAVLEAQRNYDDLHADYQSLKDMLTDDGFN